MADSGPGNTQAPKPSSSVKLVLLGEAAVGKVCYMTHGRLSHCHHPSSPDSTLSFIPVPQPRISKPLASAEMSPWRCLI